jgi:hypothetical protein
MSDNSFASINFNDPNSVSIFQTHSKMMCPLYKEDDGNSFNFNIHVKKIENKNNGFFISGKLNFPNFTQKLFIKYTASSPPTYNSNFSGSGLPFPNEFVAFENSPNKGVAEVINGNFNFSLLYPNSYYTNMGTVYVPPQVKLMLVDRDNKSLNNSITINLGEGIPFRTLTWPVQRNWNQGPEFYNIKNLPVRSQYQILLDSAYPSTNKMPKNFWGSTPPH